MNDLARWKWKERGRISDLKLEDVNTPGASNAGDCMLLGITISAWLLTR